MNLWPRPDFSVVMIVTSLFVLGVTLSFLAMTNGFTESPLVRRNTILLFTNLGAFATWIAVIVAWLKGRYETAEA